MQQLTAVRYNRFSGILFSKFYNNTMMAEVPFKYTLYCRKGSFHSTAQYTVEACEKINYFTGEPVDRLIINSDNVKMFDNAPQNIKDNLYLADLAPEYQYLINNNIKLSDKYNTAYLDIETDDDLNAEAAMSPINLVTLLYKDGDTFKAKVFSKNDFPNEASMLRSFMRFFTEKIWPDMVLGWNVVDYDRKYIINRCKVLDVKYNTDRFHMVSFMNGMDIILKKYGYAVMKKTGGMKLDNVAKHFLGKGKLEFEGTPGQLYKRDPDMAIKYNIRDCVLVKELDEKLNMSAFLINIQSVSGALIHDTLFNSVVIDVMILNKYRNYVFKSRFGYDEEEAEEYEGGYVMQPPKGVFNNVVGLDYRSLYPSIILTFNISPDTKSPDGQININGIKFRSDKVGLFTETIRFLYDTRVSLKKQLKPLTPDTIEYINLDSLQSAYKTILNSVYGVMAFRNFRFYDIDIAKSITYLGREAVQYTQKRIEEDDHGTVRYMDTDSCYVEYKTDPNELLKIVNEKYVVELCNKYGIDNQYMQMEISDVYQKMALFGKKKQYICQKSETEFYIKGISTEKYDTPQSVRKMYAEIIPTLFNGKPFDLSKYDKALRESKFDDVIMLKKFNKPIHEYKVVPQHLKALRFSTKHLPILEETKTSYLVKMVFVKVDPTKFNGDTTDCVIIDEKVKTLPDGITLDYDKYVEFFLHRKLKDVFEVFGVLDQIPPPKPKEKKPRKPRAKKVKASLTDELLNAATPTTSTITKVADIKPKENWDIF